MKKVSEVMTRDIHIAAPDQTIADAAAEMARADIGCLPVGDKDKLVGMITDRDIVVRAVAKGLDAKTRVSEVMTDSIKYCYADQSVDEVARNMAELGVRRLPVVSGCRSPASSRCRTSRRGRRPPRRPCCGS
jgi:CBS domain-containing protein